MSETLTNTQLEPEKRPQEFGIGSIIIRKPLPGYDMHYRPLLVISIGEDSFSAASILDITRNPETNKITGLQIGYAHCALSQEHVHEIKAHLSRDLFEKVLRESWYDPVYRASILSNFGRTITFDPNASSKK